MVLPRIVPSTRTLVWPLRTTAPRLAWVAKQRHDATALWPYNAPASAMGLRESDDHQHVYHRARNGQATVRASGVRFGRGALRLHVLNMTAAPLKVTLPKGSFFLSHATDEQSLLTSKDNYWRLEPHEERAVQADAYCGVSTFGCPGTTSSGRMEPTPLVAPVAVCTGQAAVWGWLDRFSPAQPNESDIMPASGEHELLEREYPDEPSLHGRGDDNAAQPGMDASHTDAPSGGSSGGNGGWSVVTSQGRGGWSDGGGDGDGGGD